MLSTDQKGNIAEQAVVYHATKLGIDVYRPVGEGGRYDMLFLLGERFLRIQCKWASLCRDVIIVRCYSARRNRDGIVRRIYAPGEIDAFAAYCPATEKCYFLPCEVCGSRTHIRLRLQSCKNNQRDRINWAAEFEFAAKLGSRQGP
jgi:PD-(D/E)XK endonuclease